MFHLFTHAFFKALLFLCSGSVIHATGTNEMPQMGGLWKKMPWTAGTMLVGCLAIAGAGVPLLVGLSGYYSKDCILAQVLSFSRQTAMHGWLFYWVAVGGAAMTAFYMFRLWYLTFAGQPRDEHVYEHAHESPRVDDRAAGDPGRAGGVAGWNVPGTHLGLDPLLEQARPAGHRQRGLGRLVCRPGHPRRAPRPTRTTIHIPATLWAFGAALGGFLLATVIYGLRKIDAEDRPAVCPRLWFPRPQVVVRRIVRIAVRPARAADFAAVAEVDRKGIDWLADGAAGDVAAVARLDDWIDRLFVDGLVNLTARWTYALGLRLRAVADRQRAAVRDVHRGGHGGAVHPGEFLLELRHRGRM